MQKTTGSIVNMAMVLGISLILSLAVSGQTNHNPPQDPNMKIFMDYFRSHWDDIHDVVMRYHHEDPWMKGTVYVRMEWVHGKLYTAAIDSNSTGNQAFGTALMDVMQKWEIPELTEIWATVLPVRTEIYGSRQPEFNERGILTGTIKASSGEPLAGTRMILIPVEIMNARADTFFSNREGIFIRTLITPGTWKLECSKEGYLNTTIDSLSVEKGVHVPCSVVLKKNSTGSMKEQTGHLPDQ
ncbi:MAG: carboxypeptidase regulatory-like domain-containing protein [Bacteroidales bacterium]|nr:carboxypeptidase regulatory-like domain-containing protein [Bacteroidales bacterium]